MTVVILVVAFIVAGLFFHLVGIAMSMTTDKEDPKHWVVKTLGLRHSATFFLLLANLVLLIHIADNLE
jgi:type IV secretory pathway TrbD component